MPDRNNNPGQGRRTGSQPDPRQTTTTVPAIRLLMRAYGVIKSKLNIPKDRRAILRSKGQR